MTDADKIKDHLQAWPPAESNFARDEAKMIREKLIDKCQVLTWRRVLNTGETERAMSIVLLAITRLQIRNPYNMCHNTSRPGLHCLAFNLMALPHDHNYVNAVILCRDLQVTKTFKGKKELKRRPIHSDLQSFTYIKMYFIAIQVVFGSSFINCKLSNRSCQARIYIRRRCKYLCRMHTKQEFR